MTANNPEQEQLTLTILGRTLEHFGVQMYKRRDAALAELVANSWDAGAKDVDIQVSDAATYSKDSSVIEIIDTGRGMSFSDVRDSYLVLGRNRRSVDGVEIDGRRLMGRKGIGKLAGFGMATDMVITTWQDNFGIEFTLSLSQLKTADGTTETKSIPWRSITPDPAQPHGTRVLLKTLKHQSALDPEGLRVSLARRFARRIKGEMTITVNGVPLPDPTPPLGKRIPEEGFSEKLLDDGNVVQYWYGFADETIKSRELRGFSVLVNGKTAQAPPFFFDVEGTASGQHSTKYVVGEIEADFLDATEDDESDVIATDRQEIDWEHELTASLASWGDEIARLALRECSDFRGARVGRWVLEDQELQARISRLAVESQRQVNAFIRALGPAVNERSDARELASTLVRAFEYRHFHDAIDQIEDAAADPDRLRETLERLADWKVLESRAILEVIGGRLAIIDKFGAMIANDARENAHLVGDDNLRDLLGRFPWLMNPEWQVLAEETTVTRQLREWGDTDIPGAARERFDFLALADQATMVVVELKRPGHALEVEDVHQVEKYRERLARQHTEHRFRMLMVYGGGLNISAELKASWDGADDRELLEWGDLFEPSKRAYERYRAVLEGDILHRDFGDAVSEVAQTRQVIDSGSAYRSPEERAQAYENDDEPPAE